VNYHFPLINQQQAHARLKLAWEWLKPQLDGERRFELSITPERRSTDANKKLHAELGDIAETVEWAGQKRDVETWKRLMTAAWLRARGESIEVLPALDGHGIDVVFRKTSSLSRAECAELIDFICAWKDEHMPVSGATPAART
jgi:hypothetical protein